MRGAKGGVTDEEMEKVFPHIFFIFHIAAMIVCPGDRL